VVFGDPVALSLAMGSEYRLSIREILKPAEAEGTPGQMDLIPVCRLEKECLVPGFPRIEGGVAMVDCIIRTTEMAHRGEISALVTCPINKDTIQGKEFNFPGHTEYLARMAGTDKVLMFLIGPSLRVGVVTGHLPLKDVAAAITKEKIIGKLQLMRDSLLRDFAISIPRIAVLGLNPHAGDNGLLGTEEKEIIAPAIREATEKGWYVHGPFGADGFFGSGAFRKFDAVLAMYHDQGLAPFKALAFETGVNYTAGLPVVRTSPDHGTAYDLAGKGEADESSLRAAIYTACDVYQRRREYREISSNPLVRQDVKESRDDKRE